MNVGIDDSGNYIASYGVYAFVISVFIGVKFAVICRYLLDDSVSNNKRADKLPTLIDYISILYYEVTHNLVVFSMFCYFCGLAISFGVGGV